MRVVLASRPVGEREAPAGELETRGGSSSPLAWSISLGTLILLAIGFRVPALFLVRYGGVAPDWSDFVFYHELVSYVAQGYYPDIHFWVEYPPLFPWLAVGAYRLGLLLPGWTQPFFWFDLILSAVFALADAGTIFLIDRLGDAIWGPGAGRPVATLYVALFLPVFAVLAWFDTLPLFFLLLGLYFCLARRPGAASRNRAIVLAGAAAGVGAMLKFFPLLLLPAAVLSARGDGRRWTGRGLIPLASAGLTVALIGLPFYLLGHETFLATFRSLLARGSWTSPWALIDGYYGPGAVAALPDRLFYNASALWGQPTRDNWLWWLAVAAGGAVYLWRARAALRQGSPRAAIALTALSVNLLLLLSRGFSIQYTLWVLPFAVLLLPGLTGAIFAIALTLNDVLLEGYLYVSQFPDVHALLWVSVTVRTVLLLWFAAECAAAIDPKAAARAEAIRRRLARPAVAAGVAGAVVAALVVSPSLGQAVAAKNGDDALRSALGPSNPAAVVFTQLPTYERLYRDVRPRPAVLLAEPKLLEWTGDQSLDARLTSALTGQSSVLLVTDADQPLAKVQPAIQAWLGARYGAEPERKVGSLSFVVYREDLRPSERSLGARFGPSIGLVGYRPADLTAQPGAALSLTLHWQGTVKLDHDYSVSVQLLDGTGKLVAQHDGMPADNARPTSSWRPGEDVLDPVSLALPARLPPGQYTLIVAVYDHQSLQRLRVGGADHATLGTVTVR